jgi:hypothetical protein
MRSINTAKTLFEFKPEDEFDIGRLGQQDIIQTLPNPKVQYCARCMQFLFCGRVDTL